MEKSFWLDKWQQNQIGFHLPEYHPLLQKFNADVFSTASSVFVPLCGKTKDMEFLYSQGFSVLGNEFSSIATEDFFAAAKLDSQHPLNIIEQDPFIRYQQDKIEILVGDFFELTSDQLKDIRCIYDRASLIALPKEKRKSYVTHMTRIIPNATMLLITLDYDQQIMAGPPFSVDKNEVEQLFSFAKIKQLHRRDIIRQEPRFKGKGLTSFYQTAYEIEWQLNS